MTRFVFAASLLTLLGGCPSPAPSGDDLAEEGVKERKKEAKTGKKEKAPRKGKAKAPKAEPTPGEPAPGTPKQDTDGGAGDGEEADRDTDAG